MMIDDDDEYQCYHNQHSPRLLQLCLLWIFPKMCSFSQKSLTLCSWLSSAPYINRHFLTYCMSGYAVIMLLKKYSFGRLERKNCLQMRTIKVNWTGKGSQTCAPYRQYTELIAPCESQGPTFCSCSFHIVVMRLAMLHAEPWEPHVNMYDFEAALFFLRTFFLI